MESLVDTRVNKTVITRLQMPYSSALKTNHEKGFIQIYVYLTLRVNLR